MKNNPNPHNNTRAYILARGPSIKHYRPEPENKATTYGINNIFEFHPVKHLVAIDNPFQFIHISDPEFKRRVEVTKASQPEFWHQYSAGTTRGLETKNLISGPQVKYNGANLFSKKGMPFSNTSAFTAACLAARHSHNEIIMYGNDWYGYPELEARAPDMILDWQALADEMTTHGITLYVGHEMSYLARILPIWKNRLS